MSSGRRPLRVLVVDDTAIVRTVIRRVLEADDRFEVIGEATNGREAIERTNELSPELVLLDLAMPEMDGLEALPQLRACACAPHVIVLSAFSPDHMAVAAIEAGALSYLEKAHLATKLVGHIVAAIEAVEAPRCR